MKLIVGIIETDLSTFANMFVYYFYVCGRTCFYNSLLAAPIWETRSSNNYILFKSPEPFSSSNHLHTKHLEFTAFRYFHFHAQSRICINSLPITSFFTHGALSI